MILSENWYPERGANPLCQGTFCPFFTGQYFARKTNFEIHVSALSRFFGVQLFPPVDVRSYSNVPHIKNNFLRNTNPGLSIK